MVTKWTVKRIKVEQPLVELIVREHGHAVSVMCHIDGMLDGEYREWPGLYYIDDLGNRHDRVFAWSTIVRSLNDHRPLWT